MTSSDNYTRETDKRFTLRINKELFSMIEESAKKNKRAVGREIEFILEQYYQNKTHKE
ncbi:hypothetical protein ACWEWU_09335 [Staphylococcus xylosus]